VRRAGHAVRLVTAATQGVPPPPGDWPIVLDIANRGWLVPAIHVALDGAGRLDEVPADVREYLIFLHNQNFERNRRLRAQLIEATSALNAAGIEPILLKGAIHLFCATEEKLGARMISDLDIHIDCEDRSRATTVLMGLGYCTLDNSAALARSCDAGVIDLHDQPNSRSAPYLQNDLGAVSSRAERFGANAHIPCATARALHFIVHDMIKDGDHWSFRIDLRHLHDLAELARSDEGIDWHWLSMALANDVARQALIGQARALEDLFGVPIPDHLRGGRGAELRHLARLVCASRGLSASTVRFGGNILRAVHQNSQGYNWRGASRFRRQVVRRFAQSDRGSKV
jgi:hypothetical protein